MVNLLTASTNLISIFLFITLFLFFVRKIVKKIGLVDKPNLHKRHQGLIPLVGGTSVYAGTCFTFLTADYYIPHATLYLACVGVLVFIGALDNRFDISVKIRAIIQAITGIVMTAAGKLHLLSLGSIFGPWEVVLGPFSYFLTPFAVWAETNVFSMVDGIDDLLGGLSSVSLVTVELILWSDGQTSLAVRRFAMIAVTPPYVMLNLDILGRRYKIFTGNVGSTLTGFTAIWTLLETTQGETHLINPVTALWIIAIPLMDMVATMYRRLCEGMSSLSPDRQHIHHLIMCAGFTSRQAFVLITLAAAILVTIGVLAKYSQVVPEWVMLVLFLPVFVLYDYCIKRAWKVARFIKRWRRKLRRNRDSKPDLTKQVEGMMTQPSPGEHIMSIENELDTRGLFRTLWIGKVWIVGTVLALALVTLAYTFFARQERSATAISDRPTVNILGGYYSQQQFLRNPDIKVSLTSAGQPSVMDEAYKEFIMQPVSWDTCCEFWQQADYYKQRMVGNSKADAAMLDELINNIQFMSGDAVRNTNNSVKLIVETTLDVNNLLRQYVAFASQRAACHLNDELKGVWAACIVQMKAQVKRQEEVTKSTLSCRVHNIEQALKIAEQYNISRTPTDVPVEELSDSELFLLGRPMLQTRLENLQSVGPDFDLGYFQNRAMLNTLSVGPTLDPRFQTYRYLCTPEESVKRDSLRRAFLMIMWGIVGALIGAGVASARHRMI